MTTIRTQQPTFVFQPFAPAADDPLASAHRTVLAWVEAAAATRGQDNWYQDVDLKSVPEGVAIAECGPADARAFVMAALAQVRHWDAQVDQIRQEASDELHRANPHLRPGWTDIWVRRLQANRVITALMRRALPFTEADLLALLNWYNGPDRSSASFAPLGAIVKAVERFAANNPLTLPLREALAAFATHVRNARDKDAGR
jgi:hypothetical protein